MLNVGLTGGIAAGKSLAATRLSALGATLVDADAIAREVVEPGTDGLRAVVEAFGPGILTDTGSLDRPALGELVFNSPGQRQRLNAIIHPLVRTRAAELAQGGEGGIVVQDIPLLIETGQGPSFHLVVVIDAPEEERVRRMVEDRGMSEADARARIAAQVSPTERTASADVVLPNTGSRDQLLASVDTLWEERLLPFHHNLLDGRIAPRYGPPLLLATRPQWPDQAALLTKRILLADPRILAVDHIGSTAVPGLPAKDVLDLQATVHSLDDADAVAGVLTSAGFPRCPGIWQDTPKSSHPDPADWAKRLHGNADPGRAVNVHIRVFGSPGWRYSLLFRDWLSANPSAAAAYAAEKRRLAEEYSMDNSTDRYAQAKEDWFSRSADPLMNQWAQNIGWHPPALPH
ncbi:dephospho-CoA kinase [Arthrobacter roseus]|uniref:dephospho-CoA kinase n=1 Tax=Arthrobacter roseus TaxID=136274 RepID=UPI0019638000|nr:dephospho-CoA kinase [Arthrobacter roseus]MBM7848461.1 dephospho-CoA kinase [Arthrobacter roseus]